MFNEKALRDRNRQERRQQKGSFDPIDAEAERQGNARRFFSEHEVGPSVLGRRISKETRKADGCAKTADAKATKNLVKDTAAVASRLVTKQMTLRQN